MYTIQVVFGRSDIFRQDILFNHHKHAHLNDVTTAAEYSENTSFALQDIYDQVLHNLQLSKVTMRRQYNKIVRFNNYQAGEKVWLKVKHYKTDDNRKLSPRRKGPWLVIEKLPNGVKFQIINDQIKQQKIVHHGRLSPVRGRERLQGENEPPLHKQGQLNPDHCRDGCLSSDFSSDSSDSEYEDDFSSDEMETPTSPRRYPLRLRPQRQLPGQILLGVLDN